MVNEKLKQAQIEKGLSQTELARLLGVSRQTINMIENDDYNPTIALCLKIWTRHWTNCFGGKNCVLRRTDKFNVRKDFPQIHNIFHNNRSVFYCYKSVKP